MKSLGTEYRKCILNAFSTKPGSWPSALWQQTCGCICGWEFVLSFYVPAAASVDCPPLEFWVYSLKKKKKILFNPFSLLMMISENMRKIKLIGCFYELPN